MERAAERERVWGCPIRTGWYEFTHTASNFNITSTDNQLSNFTGSAHNAFEAFQSTKGSLIAGGNPSIKVPLLLAMHALCCEHPC
jgi:hypothetical protein